MRAKRNADKALMSVLPMIARARVAQLQTDATSSESDSPSVSVAAE
jgi:hypothetical protein